MQQDQDRLDGMTDIITEPTMASRLETFAGEDHFYRIRCTSCLPSNLAVVGSLPAFIWEEDQGHYKYDLATTIERDPDPGDHPLPHQLKNTPPPEVVLPLY